MSGKRETLSSPRWCCRSQVWWHSVTEIGGPDRFLRPCAPYRRTKVRAVYEMANNAPVGDPPLRRPTPARSECLTLNFHVVDSRVPVRVVPAIRVQ